MISQPQTPGGGGAREPSSRAALCSLVAAALGSLALKLCFGSRTSTMVIPTATFTFSYYLRRQRSVLYLKPTLFIRVGSCASAYLWVKKQTGT
jgi:hypothetical protein